jgi:hypothetical protein
MTYVIKATFATPQGYTEWTLGTNSRFYHACNDAMRFETKADAMKRARLLVSTRWPNGPLVGVTVIGPRGGRQSVKA